MTNSEKDSTDTEEKPNFIGEGNKFCCLFCGNKYLSQARCVAHTRFCDEKDDTISSIEVNGVPKFECKVCTSRFKHLVGMKNHEQKHKFPGGFACSTCGERYTSKEARIEHQKAQHKAEKEFKIVTKQESFSSVTSDIDEKQPEIFRCNKCAGVFRKHNVYHNHINTKCGTEKQFECGICLAKFLTKNTLFAHKQIHTGVKGHLCDYCGASFLSKGQLKVHERSHTGEKPFKCEICNKGFSYRESLVTHSSIHTGIKPYACQACDLRFSCIGNLIKHRRARPDTCGQAKYQQNYKIAPRASTKIKHILNEVSTIETDPEIKQIIALPIRETSPPVFESPPTIKKFSETTIADQKPILYRITEITPVEPQIIDLNNVDEIRSLKDDNIILTMKDDQDKTDEVDEDEDSEAKLDESTEEYLHFIQSDENSGGDEEEYVTAGWYDKSEEIEYIENDNETTETNYVLQIELQNPGQPEPPPNSFYTIINSSNDDDCDTFIIQAEPEKESINEVLIKFEKPDQAPEIQEKETTSLIEDSGTPALHQCTFCPKWYIQQNRLKNHLLIDHAQNDEKTEHQQEEENTRIIEDGGSSEVHKCPLCPKLYIQPIRLKNHLVGEHSAKNEFACQICHKWYKSEDERIRHEANHGNDGSLIHKCPTCELYFGSLDELETHHNEIHFCFRCPKCSTVVDTMDALKSHMTKHQKPRGSNGQQKNLKCESCNRMFSTKVALSDHQRSDCGRAPLYKCDVCDKSYHSAGSLKTHKTVHTGALPFKCKFCGKMFRTKGQVKVHERQHNGEKPFKCDLCPKQFAYRESLLTHQSIHTGHKRFKCISCESRFSCISNLQSHRKSHKLTCGQHPNFTKPIDSPDPDVEMKVFVE